MTGKRAWVMHNSLLTLMQYGLCAARRIAFLGRRRGYRLDLDGLTVFF